MSVPRITEIYSHSPDFMRRVLKPVLAKFPTVRIRFAENSYLREHGWFNSYSADFPVDDAGNPIPWYSYPFIDFLEQRLPSDLRVFEYGSGSSTLWYADKVDGVVAVEHSSEWYQRMQSRIPSNVTLRYRTGDAYVTEALEHDEFDIVVIDGWNREQCIEPALYALSHRGVIVVDDYWQWATEAGDEIEDAGFKTLPFSGPKAQRLTKSTTAVYYRDENCLEI